MVGGEGMVTANFGGVDVVLLEVLLKRAMIGCQRDDQLWGSGYSIAGCPCTAMVSRTYKAYTVFLEKS